MPISHDTIAAIATAHGMAGIAVLRISGPDAYTIALKHLAIKELSPRHATFSIFLIGDTVIDEVVATYFPAPHNYTGEDTVEISCHGSIYIQQTILDTLISSGARLAEAGEFTQRAFLNGRLNLSQSEAVADLIESTNRGAHKLAMSQMRGTYEQRLKALRQQFVELTSLMELELDFSEEDVEFADRSRLLDMTRRLYAECSQMKNSFRQGNAIRNGVAVAIIGAPNVGKSTLLNALVGDDRAIVSDTPGTTRDTIEDTLTINGILFRFIDTAGIRHSDDTIENAGIRRSIEAARRADIILYLVTADTPQTDIEQQIQHLGKEASLNEKKLVIVQTKCALTNPITLDAEFTETEHFDEIKCLQTSAKEGDGIEELKNTLLALITNNIDDETPIVSNSRHLSALQEIVAILPRIETQIKANHPADLIVIDLREILYHLGTITGEVASNEILHTIFSRFCIGK